MQVPEGKWHPLREPRETLRLEPETRQVGVLMSGLQRPGRSRAGTGRADIGLPE